MALLAPHRTFAYRRELTIGAADLHSAQKPGPQRQEKAQKTGTVKVTQENPGADMDSCTNVSLPHQKADWMVKTTRNKSLTPHFHCGPKLSAHF